MLSTQLTLHPHSVYVVMRRILLQNRSDLLTSFHHYKAIPVLCFFFFLNTSLFQWNMKVLQGKLLKITSHLQNDLPKI